VLAKCIPTSLRCPSEKFGTHSTIRAIFVSATEQYRWCCTYLANFELFNRYRGLLLQGASRLIVRGTSQNETLSSSPFAHPASLELPGNGKDTQQPRWFNALMTWFLWCLINAGSW